MTYKSLEPFWVSNISNRNVSLRDLGLTIPAGKTVNLLDKNHSHLTKEEVITSAVSGSLFNKKNMIVVCKVTPRKEEKNTLEIEQNPLIQSRGRSVVRVEEIKYEELDIPDDIFAEQAADFVDEHK